jgi:hypothetical protein
MRDAQSVQRLRGDTPPVTRRAGCRYSEKLSLFVAGRIKGRNGDDRMDKESGEIFPFKDFCRRGCLSFIVFASQARFARKCYGGRDGLTNLDDSDTLKHISDSVS